MPSSYFDDLMANAVPEIMRAFGREITSYVSADGTAQTAIVLYVGPVATEQSDTDEGSSQALRRRPFTVLTCDQDEEFPGLELVQLRGKVLIDGVVWEVEDIRFSNEWEIHGMLVNSRERRRLARGSFRK